MISMLPLLNAGTDGIGTCQKRILGNVLRGVTALPRQCGSSRLPGSNSPPSSRAPGRNRPLCRRQPKIPHRPPTEKLRSARVGSSRRSQLTMRITDSVRLEAPYFGFPLRTPEIVERVGRRLGIAELRAEISLHLRHAQHGLGRNVAVIGNDRGDDVDRAGALLDRLPRLAIGLHAAIDIFGPR